MKKLEDFIKENRQQFENHSPGRNHEEKFLRLLNQQESIRYADKFSSISKWLKIAAAVLVLAGFGIAIISIIDRPSMQNLQTSNNLPAEIVELEEFYALQTKEKLNQIETLAGSGQESNKIKTMLLKEIKTLNQSSASLKSEYLGGTHDERLVDAIKNNYRILSSLLDKVVSQLDKPADGSSENMNQKQKSRKYENTFS